MSAIHAPMFSGPLGDPYWADVKLLMHFASDFTDQKGNTFTQYYGTNTVGLPAKFDNAIQGAVAASIYCSSANFVLPGVFTIEGWFYTETDDLDNDKAIFEIWDGIYSFVGLYGSGADQKMVVMFGTGAEATALPVYSISVWNHFALVRNSSNELKLYINGVLKHTILDFSTGSTSLKIYVAGAKNNPTITNWIGAIDEFRITKGVARYTANFTPPTAPFPNS